MRKRRLPTSRWNGSAMRRRTRASARHRRCLRLRGRREIDEICGGGGGTPRVRADTAASPKIMRNPTVRNSSWMGGPVRTSAGFSSMRVTAKRVSSSTIRSISGCPPGRPSALARRLASRTSRAQRFRSSRVAGVAPTLSGTVPGDCALCATLPRRSTFLSAMCAPIQAATGVVAWCSTSHIGGAGCWPRSGIPPWPTPSLTGSCTTPTNPT